MAYRTFSRWDYPRCNWPRNDAHRHGTLLRDATKYQMRWQPSLSICGDDSRWPVCLYSMSDKSQLLKGPPLREQDMRRNRCTYATHTIAAMGIVFVAAA